MRRDILYGNIPAGTKLAQQQLCETYNTSRMPIRDALRQLAYEGLLVADDTNHLLVASFTHEDLLDIFKIQGNLHAMAWRRLASRRDPEVIEALRARQLKMVDAEHAEDFAQMAALNWDFHRYVNRVGGTRVMRASMVPVAAFTPRDFVVEFPQWARRSNVEHAQLIEAVSEGDETFVESLAKRHVEQAGRDYIAHYEAKGLAIQRD
jgi:DNA-binding GntR family transcriptional regulator